MSNSADESPFYRVTGRAIILVDNKLVVVKDNKQDWQIPGGGWEHSESFSECMEREVNEELGVSVAEVSPISFCYRQYDKRGYISLRLAALVSVNSTEFKPGDDMVLAKLVTKSEFLGLEFCPGEGPIQDFVDQIWPTS